MAGYTSIMETGNALVRILQEGMVPELIGNSGSIGLCSPADKGDYALGLHLYDIRECGEVRQNGMINAGLSRQKYPPLFVSLFYMVTAYSDSDLKFRAAQEQRILGRAMQLFYDNQVIAAAPFEGMQTAMDIHIELLDLELDDKFKIWNMPDVAYRPSLYYKVGPVAIESARQKKITRVTELVFDVKE